MKTKQVLRNFLIYIDKHSYIPFFHPFRMTKDEKKLFDDVIRNSKFYLEFGAGGSTFRSLRKSNAIVFSVDSSLEWIKLMEEYVFIKRMQNKKRLKLIHVDIGKTGLWGHPLDAESKELFPSFSSKVFGMLKQDVNLDTILIDGRFRVACTLKAIIEYVLAP